MLGDCAAQAPVQLTIIGRKSTLRQSVSAFQPRSQSFRPSRFLTRIEVPR